MSFEIFISRRLIQNKLQGIKVSKPIVRISVLSIALAIVVNVVTVAIVTGFQHEVRNKITGFNAPLFISKKGTKQIFEGDAVLKDQKALKELAGINGLKGISPVVFKPAMLQSTRFSDTIHLSNGKDSLINRQDILGVVMKGVIQAYDWTFIKEHLVAGRVLNFQSKQEELVLSKRMADQLNYSLNDTISVYYVKNQPVLRKYKVVGIYQTGLEEYDQKLVFCRLPEVQKMNDFGIKTKIIIDDKLSNGKIVLKAGVEGKASDLLYDWGAGPDIYGGFYLPYLSDTNFRLIVYQSDPLKGTQTPIDTSYIQINCSQAFVTSSALLQDENGELIKESIGINSYQMTSSLATVQVTETEGLGTGKNFVSGFEVQITDWNQLKHVEEEIRSIIEMRPNENNELMQVSSILDTERDLFAWLSFLDYNVYIIIFLMLLIGVINVGSAMLVLIVVRTNLIGMLKAMGARDWSIRKLFLYQAAHLIGRGLLYGNSVAFVLCFIQMKFAVLKLDPLVYYLDKVPVEMNPMSWFLVNLVTFVVCMISLIVPSYVVTKISPTKAIRFN
ncbi:MAG: ABC transporter permease [Crocinitomicaceae bacterium]|nr:ABC transporter permease [Crocinitomicaceae bacterium]MBP6032398.1 ABC transporter permease [Crocinitomicaceae bacterium]